MNERLKKQMEFALEMDKEKGIGRQTYILNALRKENDAEHGWHLAFIKNVTRWCLDEDLDLKKRFAEHLHNEFGLYHKCVPVGMSCGGLIACKLAAKYPDLISALYLDAPVMNFLSCPAGIGVAENSMLDEFINATGITLSELTYYRENPIDKMPMLLKNKLPIIMVYGDSDTVVP